MEYQEVMAALFSGKTVPRIDRERHAFMLNRALAIKHPATANGLNMIGTDRGSVFCAWSFLLGSPGRVPGWAYTRPSKEVKADRDGEHLWMTIHGLGPKDLKEAKQIDPDGLAKEIAYLKEVTQG